MSTIEKHTICLRQIVLELQIMARIGEMFGTITINNKTKFSLNGVPRISGVLFILIRSVYAKTNRNLPYVKSFVPENTRFGTTNISSVFRA